MKSVVVSFKPLIIEVEPKRENIFERVEEALAKAEAIMNSDALLKFRLRLGNCWRMCTSLFRKWLKMVLILLLGFEGSFELFSYTN